MAIADIRIDIQSKPDELRSLERIRSHLQASRSESHPLELIVQDTSMGLPDSLRSLLEAVVPLLLQHRSISVFASDDELTTQQAAAMLNVSRQHVVNLVEAGKLPAHKVGTHRRILVRDLLKYRASLREDQENALDELARLSFDEGMYDKHPESS